jgi:hypothetical protein
MLWGKPKEKSREEPKKVSALIDNGQLWGIRMTRSDGDVKIAHMPDLQEAAIFLALLMASVAERGNAGNLQHTEFVHRDSPDEDWVVIDQADAIRAVALIEEEG